MNYQYQMTLLTHEIEAEVVHQRAQDGYVNATAMCKAAGKLFADYNRLESTKAFLAEMSSDMGYPISELVQSLKGGLAVHQGTWVHPQVAINLAQWLSPKFAVQVSKWVHEWMTGQSKAAAIPYHLRRYISNAQHVPAGCFSILNEMMMHLIGPMENMGYTLPERMVPDISEGKMFSKLLRSMGIDTDAMATYPHRYEDGRTVQARAYPNSVLPQFREHFIQIWIKTKARAYFADRDPQALPYLDKLLGLPSFRAPPKLTTA